MFFEENWKFDVALKIAKKMPEKVYGSLDNLI